MAQFNVKYGGRQGKSILLKEATDLLVVRTHSGRSVRNTDLTSHTNRKLSGKEIVFSMPHVGVEVIKVGSSRSRNAFRKSLAVENDIRYAGRAFKLGESDVPVLYTENLFLKLKDKLTKSECTKLIKSKGLTIKRSLGFAENAYFVAATDGIGHDIFSLPDSLFANKEVELCHPELIMPRHEKTAFPQQWHLQKSKLNGSYVDAHANVVEAWNSSVGKDVVIAVIDDGVDENHEEFSTIGKIVAARDVTLHKDSAAPGANNDHGTACAGVACGDGLYGASGVAPEAKLMPIRLQSSLGSMDEADAFYHAAQNGADIISCSWGPRDGNWWDPTDPLHNEVVLLPDSTRLAIDYAVENGREGKGCVVTWAAGNGRESADNDGYASYEKVISVAACNDRGTRSVYSDSGKSVLCCFPSNDFEYDDLGSVRPLTSGIWTSDRSGNSGYNYGTVNLGDTRGNYTNAFGGTSSACPGVAGVAALILSVNPNLNYDEVRTIIIQSCDQIDVAGGVYDRRGHSEIYGYGRINAAKAVANAINVGGNPNPSSRTSKHREAQALTNHLDRGLTLPQDFTAQSLDLFQAQLKFLQDALSASRSDPDDCSYKAD